MPPAAPAVTPDIGVQAGGEKLRVKQSDSVSVGYLRHQSTIDATNTVVRNGMPVEDFVAEVRELVAPSAATRLFETSDFVVIGEVVSVERGGTAEESDSPVTLRWGEGASIRVTQWLKGDSDRTHMTVLSTVPTRWQRIHDYVILEPGEVVLLFLWEEDEGHYTVVGGHDGKYRLSDATATQALRELGLAQLVEP